MKATQSIIDQRKRREARVKTKSDIKVSDAYVKNAIASAEAWFNLPKNPLHFEIPSELMRGVYKTGDDEKIESIRKSGDEYFANQDVPIDPIIGEKIWNRSLSIDGLSVSDMKIDANMDSQRLDTLNKYCKSHDESIETMKNITYHINKCIASLSKKPSFWQQVVRFFKR